MVRRGPAARPGRQYRAVTSVPPRARPGPRAPTPRGTSLVGTTVLLDVGPVAGGGVCVARHEGRVVFVRHTLPGERVRARVTDGGTGDRYLRADAVDVVEPDRHRVTPPCPYAVPGGCGGCDWQHVDVGHQRALKAAVVAEAFRRIAGLDVSVSVEPLPGSPDGLGWRTRVEFAVAPNGRAGLRRHRSHDVVALRSCAIAHAAVQESGVLQRDWTGARAVDVVVPSSGAAVVVPVSAGSEPGGQVPDVAERVVARDWSGQLTVSARGFWQVHPAAPATFVQRVLDDLAPRPGEQVLDLYAGVGLLSLPLAAAVGPRGAVTAVEGDRAAAGHGRRNATAYPQVRFVAARVETFVASVDTTDLVVLDPPRRGAGRQVMDAIASMAPRAIEYVSCDPATLARDVRYVAQSGYHVTTLHAYDAFPMTHHVECVALLEPSPTDGVVEAVGGPT